MVEVMAVEVTVVEATAEATVVEATAEARA